VIETHRQHVVELVDMLDPLAVGQLLERRNAVAHAREVDPHRLELKLLTLLARDRIQVLEPAIGPCARVVGQQRNRHVPLQWH
jgi:hypothetical protein